MISIVFVIPTLDQSGAERQLTLLATNLPKDEFRVHVIALNRGGYYAAELQRHGISVDILQKRFRFDPLTFMRLKHRLRQLQPDIVQSYLFAANAYVRMPLVVPATSRVIVSERCVDSWKSGWQLRIDRWLVNRTDAMTANSASVAAFYRDTVGVPEDRIHVIPNAVTHTADESAKRDLRTELGLPDDVRLIGFVGRLARQKCLKDLVWAFQLLHQIVDQKVALVLIGDGPERDAIAEFAVNMDCRDKLYLTGHRDDAAQLIADLDVFCLPSSFEGMSNSLMEAMACGVPVAVSDIPANLELVTDGETGLTFPLGNSPELAKVLKRLLTDAKLSQRLSGAAKKRIVEHHSVEQLVSRHRNLYRQLLHGRTRQ
ncbi:MAG: glycosyltransferase [Planctomycetaceae bacterium]